MARWIPWNYKAVPRAVPAEHGDQHAVAAPDPIPGVTDEEGGASGVSWWGEGHVLPLATVGRWWDVAAVGVVVPLMGIRTAPSNGNFVGNHIYLIPFVLAKAATLSQLSLYVSLANASGLVGKMGIYAADQDTMAPGARLVETAQFAFDGVGAKTLAAVLALEADTLYYSSLYTSNPGGAMGCHCCTGIWSPFGYRLNSLNSARPNALSRNRVWDGTMPAAFPVGAMSDQQTVPIVYGTFSSVG